MNYLGALLRDKRKAAGVTLDWMAELCGVSLPTMSAIELGKRKPGSAKLLRRIAKQYGIDYLDAVKLLLADIREGYVNDRSQGTR